MPQLSLADEHLYNLHESLTKRIEGSQVESLYGWYLRIPKLRINVRIEERQVEKQKRLYLSIVIDDPELHLFKILHENCWINASDKISYVNYFVKDELLEWYYGIGEYSDNVDKEFHRMMQDESAYNTIRRRIFQ